MDKTLFLIAAPDGAELEAILAARVQSLLPGAGAPDWLAGGEACTLALTGDETIDVVLERVREIIAGATIDAVCLPGQPQRQRLLISDMDSTVIDQECIDEVAAQAGIGAAISAITREVIAGELDFEDGFARRVALMGGISAELLEQVYQTRITFKSGAATLVATMRANGAYCALVSGGFSYFATRVAKQLGFDESLSNPLPIENNLVTGQVHPPILGRSAKQVALHDMCARRGIGPAQAMAVGDGANDIDMLAAAGLGVAINAGPRVKAAADASIDHADLTALLYLQGYRKSEFVTGQQLLRG